MGTYSLGNEMNVGLTAHWSHLGHNGANNISTYDSSQRWLPLRDSNQRPFDHWSNPPTDCATTTAPYSFGYRRTPRRQVSLHIDSVDSRNLQIGGGGMRAIQVITMSSMIQMFNFGGAYPPLNYKLKKGGKSPNSPYIYIKLNRMEQHIHFYDKYLPSTN